MRDALLDYLDVADGRVVNPVKEIRRADARGGCHRLERGIVEGDGAITEPLGVKVLPCKIMVQNHVNMTFSFSNAMNIEYDAMGCKFLQTILFYVLSSTDEWERR